MVDYLQVYLIAIRIYLIDAFVASYLHGALVATERYKPLLDPLRAMATNTEPGAKSKKLALLMCDTPIPAVREKYGTYLDIFRKQLHDSNPDVSFPFTLDGYDVVTAQEYPNLDHDAGYAGVLISGSG